MPLRYRPFTLRQHLLIVLLAIATAIIVVLMLTEQPGAPPRPRPLPAAAAGGCAPGQSSGCVGGKLDVIIVAPSAASASAP